MRYVIAGPCAIESVASFVSFADELVELFAGYPDLTLVYKGSFDKANRTRQGSPRGVGLVEAEVAWSMIRQAHPGLMITTDIHESWQARVVAPYVDVIQIPAMLGRQTDLLAAAGAVGRQVNCKIPVWEDNLDRYLDAARLKTGLERPWFTYRGNGTSSKLVVDMRQLAELDLLADHAFLDLTHTNGGDKSVSLDMARMAKGLATMNFFAETHPRPSAAVCDAANQLSVDQLRYVLDALA